MAISNGTPFPDFNNKIGRKPNKQNSTPAAKNDYQPISEGTTTDQFLQSGQPIADQQVDTVVSDLGASGNDAAAVKTTSSQSSIPRLIAGQIIAGVNEAGETKKTYEGITVLNGLGITSLESVNGITLASANPLKPTDNVKMKTTNVGTFGLGDMSFTSVNGRTIDGMSNDVPMPTTSLVMNGLESTEFTYASGRTVTL